MADNGENAKIEDTKVEEGELRFTNCIVKFPCCFILLGLFIAILLLVLDIAVLGFLLPEESAPIGKYQSKAYDATLLVGNDIQKANEKLSAGGEPAKHPANRTGTAPWGFAFLYLSDDSENGNVFTPENLKHMATAEKILVADADYNKWCQAIPYGNSSHLWGECQLPNSIVPLMESLRRLRNGDLTTGLPDWIKWFQDGQSPTTVGAELHLIFTGMFDGFSPEQKSGAVSATAVGAPITFKGFCAASRYTLGTDEAKGASKMCSVIAFSALAASADHDFYDVQFGSQEEVDNTLKDFWFIYSTSQGFRDSFFGVEFDGVGNLRSKATRSSVQYGFPLDGYGEVDSGDKTKTKEMEDKWKTYAKPFINKLTENEEQTDKDFDVIYFSGPFVFAVFQDILLRDGLLAMGSVAFVFLYIQIHTKSWFIATLGFIQIIMPFPIGYFIYRGIFQVKGFFGLSFLTIYIVLAIGADDIFVFFDAWTQARIQPKLTHLRSRFTWAWKRAATAMLVTSFTTMAAFLATMVSPLKEVSTFGLFASILVFLDYTLVITFFAAAVVIYHRNWEHLQGCCCACWSNPNNTGPDGKSESVGCSGCTGGNRGPYRTPNSRDAVPYPIPPVPERNSCLPKPAAIGFIVLGVLLWVVGFLLLIFTRLGFALGIILVLIGLICLDIGINNMPVQSRERSSLEMFMTGPMTDFMTTKKRFAPVAVLVVFWIIMVIFAAQLRPTTEADEFLPSWHPFQRFVSSILKDFKGSDKDDFIQIVVGWGLDKEEPIDREGKDIYKMKSSEPETLGVPRYTTIDFRSQESQNHILEVCNTFLDAKTPKGENVARKLGNDMDVNCFMRGFKDWVESTNGTFPVPPGDFDSLMTTWMGKRLKTEAGRGVPPHVQYKQRVLIEEGKVKYAEIFFNTTMKGRFGTPASVMKDIHDGAENQLKAENAKGKNGMEKAIQSASIWVWMITQESYVSGAITGTITSIVLSFVVLFIATQNLLIAALAILDIIGVVGSILGLMFTFGWELGSIESIAITILVGLAVDYVVHLAHAYTESPGKVRIEKVRDALGDMGATVVGGAATSAGASLMLFATYLQFFFKFGIFMFLTIGMSFLWAFGFFIPLLATFGPENDFCSFRPFLRKMMNKKGEKEDAPKINPIDAESTG